MSPSCYSTLLKQDGITMNKYSILKNYGIDSSETSYQGLFNQIHEKVTNKRLFIAWTHLLSPHMGYNINKNKENLSFNE